MTSLLPPDARPDYDGWARAMRRESAERAASKAAQRARAQAAASDDKSRTVEEDEPKGSRGSNDTADTAQAIDGFGTKDGVPRATVSGSQSPEQITADDLDAVKPNTEDDGTMKKARNTGISTRRTGITTTGFRGDAPGGGAEAKDDLDFYRLKLKDGERVTATVTRRSGDLEPYLALVDAEDRIVADTFDELSTRKVSLDAPVPGAGTYYVVATGWNVDFVDTTGKYALELAAGEDDRDVYAVPMQAGDVLGATVQDSRYVSVFGPDGTEMHRSGQDASGVYPLDSPLPGANGEPVTDYVARTDGTYYVEISGGDGRYISTLEVYRYGGSAGRQTQTIYLDTDGARLNTRIFNTGGGGVATLSPLKSFLGKWGLTRAQEPELIDAIKANVQESVERDLAAAGLSDTVSVEVVASGDGPDPTGQPGVTRLVLGGTIEESGIGAIGIAQSIDPGNFARTETGLVLMDVLSEPGNIDAAPASINSYLTSDSDRLAFVAQAIGNVTVHEAGHMFGNFHTDNSNAVANLMDAGGDGFDRLFGVGPDGVGGTTDDDVDFVTDRYDPFEGFVGDEDTVARSTWGMSTR